MEGGHQPSNILERKIKALCILYHTIGTNSGFALGQTNTMCPKCHKSSGVLSTFEVNYAITVPILRG